jgi:hypothetical protein
MNQLKIKAENGHVIVSFTGFPEIFVHISSRQAFELASELMDKAKDAKREQEKKAKVEEK